MEHKEVEADKENLAVEHCHQLDDKNKQISKNQAFEDAKEDNKSDQLIVIGGNNTTGNTKASLQDHFKRFRKKRTEQIKYKQFLSSKNKNVDRKDPVFKQRLREKFVETAKKYYGVPYAKRYHNPGDKHYDSPLFLDC